MEQQSDDFWSGLFPELHEPLRRRLRQAGIRLYEDDIANARAILFSGSAPGRPAAVIDRGIQTEGGLLVHLFFHIWGHLLHGDANDPWTCVVEAKQYGSHLPGATPNEVRAHEVADTIAGTLFWMWLKAIPDRKAAQRLRALGVKDPDLAISLCAALPGSRRRLRIFASLFGSAWARRFANYWLPRARWHYRRARRVSRLLAPEGGLVSTLRLAAVAAEIREFLPFRLRSPQLKSPQ